MLAVLQHALWRRRVGLSGWSAGIVAVAALVVVAYPTVRDNTELDKTFDNLSPGVRAVLGLGDGTTLTSPVGYLNSQFFTNVLPIMLLVFAIGVGAWTIAGDETAGTLELLLANPVSRVRTAIARAAALTILVAVLVAVCTVTLIALAPTVGLATGQLTPGRIAAATLASGAMALTFGALAFAVGAATGSRPMAVSVPAGLAVAGYVIEGIAQQVRPLQPLRAASPWHWLIATDPLAHGLTWRAGPLPVAVSLVVIAIGTLRLARRDLH